MSNITKLVEDAIRAHPLLYPNRITVLQNMFNHGGVGGWFIHPVTGDMINTDRSSRIDYEPMKNTSGSLNVEQMNATDQFISDNAKRFAESSIHDKMTSIQVPCLPKVDGQWDQCATMDELSDDTKSAWKEYVRAVDDEIQTALHKRLSTPRLDSYARVEKVWNANTDDDLAVLTKIGTITTELMEEFTGMTREERIQTFADTIKKLLEEGKDNG
jgi:hypothetical protein